MNGLAMNSLAISGLALLADISPHQNASIFDPASPPAEAIRSLSWLVAAISAFIFVIVEGVLFYSIARFRRKDETDRAEPPQVYGSFAIEIAWTAAPALIVFILVLVVVRTLWDVNRPAPEPRPGDNALFVTVIGHQWWWEYVYEHHNGQKIGVITANELHVPASTGGVRRPVYLTLKSADVCHSFWVPRLAGKTDVIPNHPNQMWFETEKLGLFVGQCAEYCGTQHANMLLRVVVDEPDEFQRWLKHEAEPAVEEASLAQAKATFLGLSCINCHRVRGTLARGTYAPDLTHLMSRQTLASGMVPNNTENLRRWLVDPQNVKPGCLMPAFGLSSSNVDLVARYLLSLR